MKLGPVRIELLETVRYLGEPAAADVARHRGRWPGGSTYRVLRRLVAAGYLEEGEYRCPGSSRTLHGTFRLTDAGRAALSEQGEDGV
jgi:hypothetical protein